MIIEHSRRTDNSNYQLAVLTINAHHEGVVHDVDLCEESTVVEESSPHDPLRVFAQIERVEMRSYIRSNQLPRIMPIRAAYFQPGSRLITLHFLVRWTEHGDCE